MSSDEAGESTVDDLGPDGDAVEDAAVVDVESEPAPAQSTEDSSAEPESGSESPEPAEADTGDVLESEPAENDVTEPENATMADDAAKAESGSDVVAENEAASDADDVIESEPDADNVIVSESDADNVIVSEADADNVIDSQPGAENVSESEPDSQTDPATGESSVDGESATVDDEEGPTLDLVDPIRLRSALEAVLLVVDQPIDITTLAQTLAVPKPDAEAALHALRTEYDEASRGMDLREVAGGWRLYSRDDFARYVERFVLDGQQTRLTQAALETLAVIAYRQPVTRARVSAIRGVGVDAVIRTLTTRALIEECGTDPETGGGLYRTTPLFLEKLGLGSLDDLPALAPLLPDHTELDTSITDA